MIAIEIYILLCAKERERECVRVFVYTDKKRKYLIAQTYNKACKIKKRFFIQTNCVIFGDKINERAKKIIFLLCYKFYSLYIYHQLLVRRYLFIFLCESKSVSQLFLT
jgi:hypothetical protein